MTETGEKSIECGFCLQKDSALVNPKLLPCSHVHCYGCMTAYFNRLHVVRCPTCKEVFDVTLDSLPAAELVEDISPACDTCTRRGVKDELAETYCVTCSRKYCKRHREHHDELYDDHANISITENPSKYRKLEVRTCTEHRLPLILGCKTCCTLVCAECCTSGLSVCTIAYRPHELTALNKLAKKITEELDRQRVKVMETEEMLDEHLKRMSTIIADYETETEEMVERIHQRRDEQVETIREKYDCLENELLELRTQCKSRMTRFMEDDVGVKLSNMNQHRVEIEARVKHIHQVDFIAESKDIISEMMRLHCDGVPELRIEGLNKLNTKEEKREIELVIVSADGLISCEEGLTVGRAVLKSIGYMKIVPLPEAPSSVCHYQGNLHVALGDNTVTVVDDNYEPKNSHIILSEIVEYVTVYKDRVYTLLRHSIEVHVHDLSGQIITSWCHSDIGSDNCLVGIADQIVIPDRTYGRLALYSLTGEIEKHIPCPLLHGGEVAICAINDDSVIVSNKSSNRVLRMNLSTGEVVWSSHVTNPTGVECYKGGSVLVAMGEMGVIHILDIRTGNYMDEVTAVYPDGNLSGSTRNLCIFDDTLIVTAYDNCDLLYYGIDNHKDE